MIVSHYHYIWFVTLVTLGTSLSWMVVDIVRLSRVIRQGRAAHDRIFGSVIGLMVALIGMTGVITYHFG